MQQSLTLLEPTPPNGGLMSPAVVPAEKSCFDGSVRGSLRRRWFTGGELPLACLARMSLVFKAP